MTVGGSEICTVYLRKWIYRHGRLEANLYSVEGGGQEVFQFSYPHL
jgi:hypothetical protein